MAFQRGHGQCTVRVRKTAALGPRSAVEAKYSWRSILSNLDPPTCLIVRIRVVVRANSTTSSETLGTGDRLNLQSVVSSGMVGVVNGTISLQSAGFSLQAAGLFASPLGKLLAALVVVAVVLFVGRFVMNVAWRLLRIAIVLVGAAWFVSVFTPGMGI